MARRRRSASRPARASARCRRCFPPTGPKGIGYSNDNVGAYAERMLLSEALLLEVPNGLAAEHAALTEPLAVGIHAVEKANVRGGEVPLVIGCGPVGLAVIAGLKLKGLHPIIAADYSPARRALAREDGRGRRDRSGTRRCRSRPGPSTPR